MMTKNEILELIKTSTSEHKLLDDKIKILSQQQMVDLMEINRLKKDKLAIKDKINKLNAELPNGIA